MTRSTAPAYTMKHRIIVVRPSKEQVRAWLAERMKERRPLPDLEQIRGALQAQHTISIGESNHDNQA